MVVLFLRVALVVFLLGEYSSCYGQHTVLFQKNRIRQAYYEVGDQLHFRVEGDKSKQGGRILDITDSTLVFDNYSIDPYQISHLYFDDQTRSWYILRFKADKLLAISGGGYIALDLLNRGEVDTGVLKAGGAMLGAALLIRLLVRDYIEIRGKRKLVILSQ